MAEKKNDPVDVDLATATPVEPGDPVEAAALSQMGATFAERQAAREKFEKAAAKSVKSDAAEDKSVSSASTKSRTKKKS